MNFWGTEILDDIFEKFPPDIGGRIGRQFHDVRKLHII